MAAKTGYWAPVAASVALLVRRFPWWYAFIPPVWVLVLCPPLGAVGLGLKRLVDEWFGNSPGGGLSDVSARTSPQLTPP